MIPILFPVLLLTFSLIRPGNITQCLGESPHFLYLPYFSTCLTWKSAYERGLLNWGRCQKASYLPRVSWTSNTDFSPAGTITRSWLPRRLIIYARFTSQAQVTCLSSLFVLPAGILDTYSTGYFPRIAATNVLVAGPLIFPSVYLKSYSLPAYETYETSLPIEIKASYLPTYPTGERGVKYTIPSFPMGELWYIFLTYSTATAISCLNYALSWTR